MSKSRPAKSASQLQDAMFEEIAKIDKRYLKLIAPHEKAKAQLEAECKKEKAKTEKKYLAMIEQLDKTDIPFSYGLQ